MTSIQADCGLVVDFDRAVAAPRGRRLDAWTPLFTGGAPRTLVQRSVTLTSTATHLAYDVIV